VIRPSRGDYFRSISNIDAANLGRTHGGNLTLRWTLANGFMQTAITGFRSTLQDLNIDLSDQSPSRYQLLQRQDNDQLSEELQLAGNPSDSLRFVGGLYYFDENTEAAVTDRIAPNFFNKSFTVDSKNQAAFGQLEYSTGAVKLVGGLRHTRDDKELRVSQTGNQTGLFVYDTATLIARGAAGQNINPDRRFSELAPKAGINWEVSDDLFAYASYTNGYRSGGWTGRATRADQYVNFDPEEVESYEIGPKATLADGRLRWNNTLFRMDYTNLFNTLNIAGVFTVRTADATLQGLESEFTMRATSWLDLFVNAGLLDSKYTGARPANLAPGLQRAPALQGKAGFSVQYPLAAGTLLVNGDVYHTEEHTVSYIGSYAAVYAGAPRLYRVDFSYKFVGDAR
jgi:iron complex outermembrane recepter protein